MSAKDKRARAKQRRREEAQRQAEQAREQERRARRRRAVTMGFAAVAVLVLVAIVTVVVQRLGGPDEGPSPTGAVAAGTALPVGKRSAPVTLTVYEDFRCPACGDFEQRFGTTIDELVDDGSLRVEYHVATIIDAPFRGSGSKVAGNAAACAQDAGRFRAYHARLFAHQPPESEDGFTEERVIELARGVPGLVDADFRSCVRDERYRPWLEQVQAEFDDRFDRAATPTVLLDGKLVLGGSDGTFAKVIKTPAALEREVTRRAERS